MIEELLHKFGISRSSLSAVEMDTIDGWARALQSKRLAPEDILTYINAMIDGVEREIAGYEVPATFTALLFRKKRRVYLEARLYNYIMLRDFLIAPEKAKKYVENQLKNLSHQVGKIS